MRVSTTLALASTWILTVASALLPRQERACNGHAEYCDRAYSNVTQIGTHNSAFVGHIPDPRINQEKTVTEQLNAGIRFLQAQTHEDPDDGTLKLCHSHCLLFDAGSLENYLQDISDWLTADENANEVLTILLTNGDGAAPSVFDAAFATTALKDLAFVPDSSPDPLAQPDWPTLGAMLDAHTRLVVFLDHGADEAAVDYLLPEFGTGYFWETPFDVTNRDFPQCAFDRPADGARDDRMLIMNHFLGENLFEGIRVPKWIEIERTNAAEGDGSIGAQANGCWNEWVQRPKAVLVDFFERGEVFEAERALNGL